ncbi:MAG TPA: hypothetical protein VN179_01685, partial [Solirubrobacterales bacterium]|nr:hypothetical protein [Solirubrobacterales bacterium]
MERERLVEAGERLGVVAGQERPGPGELRLRERRGGGVEPHRDAVVRRAGALGDLVEQLVAGPH